MTKNMRESQEFSMPVRPTLRGLGVNEEVSFPVERVSVVRSNAYALGLELGRVFSVHLERDRTKICVTRTA